MRLLDLFCGRWGWSRAFATRGWECVGIDLVEPPEIPANCYWKNWNVLGMDAEQVKEGDFDFIVASSPCEEFSVWGMKHFHPNPPYPEMGVKLFNHTRSLCEASGVPYVMENVRAAQQFVGNAAHHCGPWFLWGNAVPPLLHKGITKGFKHREMFAHDRTNRSTVSATIPIELADCVASYAERLLDDRSSSRKSNLSCPNR